MLVLSALLISGCTALSYNIDADADSEAVRYDSDAPRPEDSGEPSTNDSRSEDTDSTGPAPHDSEPAEEVPGIGGPGDWVISELMIDPSNSADEFGEWVEVYNASGETLDLTGVRVADEGVDDVFVEATGSGSLVVHPGDYLVLCASSDMGSNGGVACAGTFLYQTWGGGFALSNSGDEVLLVDSEGTVLDRFAYGEDFESSGRSQGVDPGALSAEGNDPSGAWCNQSGSLSAGDQGNPGTANQGCG